MSNLFKTCQFCKHWLYSKQEKNVCKVSLEAFKKNADFTPEVLNIYLLLLVVMDVFLLKKI